MEDSDGDAGAERSEGAHAGSSAHEAWLTQQLAPPRPSDGGSEVGGSGAGGSDKNAGAGGKTALSLLSFFLFMGIILNLANPIPNTSRFAMFTM